MKEISVTEAIKKRRSIRCFLEKDVEEVRLQRVLEAGRLAPSARNLQDWKFVVVRDKETRFKLAAAARGQSFVGSAPVVIAACGTEPDYIMTCGQHCYPIDVAIAVDHMTLAAVEQGLGTCWIGAFFEDQVKSILHIPERIRVVALLPLGYPAEEPDMRPRKGMDEVVSYERWGWDL